MFIQVGKTCASTASKAQTLEAAEAAHAKGTESLRVALVEQSKGTMYEMQQMSKTLRNVPEIDLCIPTVCCNSFLPSVSSVHCQYCGGFQSCLIPGHNIYLHVTKLFCISTEESCFLQYSGTFTRDETPAYFCYWLSPTLKLIFNLGVFESGWCCRLL
jgi:hypothetical protein